MIFLVSLASWTYFIYWATNKCFGVGLLISLPFIYTICERFLWLFLSSARNYLVDVFQAVEKGADPCILALHPHSGSSSGSYMFWQLFTSVTVLSRGHLEVLPFLFLKQGISSLGFYFGSQKRALMSVTLENPRFKGLELIMRVTVASICYRYPRLMRITLKRSVFLLSFSVPEIIVWLLSVL